ncbi:MAG: SHOCT domain-containing protein [Catenulispora sp.]|nr:SHOCT domain-containing protein [Catenulispora sp.]
MFSYNHNLSGWGWFGMTIGMIVFWGLLIAVGVFLYRSLSRTDAPPTSYTTAAPDPRQILAERYARGEIDDDEYQHRLATLSGGPRHPVAS